jgi:hypothetical protein
MRRAADYQGPGKKDLFTIAEESALYEKQR